MKIQIGNEVRDMTNDEKTNFENVKREAELQIAALEAAAAAKASARAKLAALGLTDAEIAAFLGA